MLWSVTYKGGCLPVEKEPGVKASGRSTSTYSFGVSKREGHDSSAFYSRFQPPVLSSDTQINESPIKDALLVQDSRDLSVLPDNCVALVVTSPPYFVGKEYEESIRGGHIPGDYLEYLEMLKDVFAECYRVLEPGGRVAVNVANLGRKPYRSLSADLVTILQDELGFLMRGEILWIKGKGANGSCAWGSYQSASNPVLRDVTERIIVGSKGSFSRVHSKKTRQKMGLPYLDSISGEEFRLLTLDTWYFPPESAKRVGHPAPFPIELPRRVIELNTYVGDIVLDPFMGAGQTALACLKTNRHYVGVEVDARYVDLAEGRIKLAKEAASMLNVQQLLELSSPPS